MQGMTDVAGSDSPRHGGDSGAECPGESGSVTSGRPHSIRFTEPSLTRQSFKDECNVTNIVNSYARTGMVNHVARMTPRYFEAPEMDYSEHMRTQAQLASLEHELELAPEPQAKAKISATESAVDALETPAEGGSSPVETADSGA